MLSFKLIARDAWKSIPSIRLAVFIYVMIISLIPYFIGIFVHRTIPLYSNKMITDPFMVSLHIVIQFIKAYLYLQIVMIGIRQMAYITVGEKKFFGINVFCLIVIYLLFDLIFSYGLFLIKLNIVEIYIDSIILFFITIPLFIFSMPFVIYNQQNFKSAFIRGYQMLGRYWKEIFLYLFLPGIICIYLLYLFDHYFMNKNIIHAYGLWSLSFFIVPIFMVFWIFPFLVNVIGILYKNASRE